MSTEPGQDKNIDLQLKGAHGNAAYNLTNKVSQNAGNTLANLWYIVFGGISEKAEEKKMRLASKLHQYQDELEQAVSKIPEENRQDPPLQIVGPALEKSRYCVESDAIRDMFVNLISKSVDKTRNNKLRPSFSEIISQMAPLDAQNLKIIYESESQLPVAKYRFNMTQPGIVKTMNSLVFLSNPEVQDIDLQASSITELSRLGLVEVTFIEAQPDPKSYDIFEKDPRYLFLKSIAPSFGESIVENDQSVTVFKAKDISIEKGMVRITPLGMDFASICLMK